MGNRVSIGTDEIIDYVIDGIPNNMLRDRACLHCFTSIELLLDAFEIITLRDRGATNSNRPDKRSNRQTVNERNGKTDESGKRNDNIGSDGKRKTISNSTRCFNCNMRDHISANCPSKALGALNVGGSGILLRNVLKKRCTLELLRSSLFLA